jgi:hypothetical protein
MIVARRLVAPDFVLQRHRHRIIIRNRQGFHAPLTLSSPSR